MLSIVLCLSLSAGITQAPLVAPVEPTTDTTRWVNFTLYNPLLRSIPLVIPGVMNPNLSPLSRSGVTLRVGQKIYYVRNGRRELFYTVPADLAPGSEVDCGALVAALNASR